MINSPTDLSACVIWLDGSNSTYFKSLSTGSGDVSNGSAVGYWQNLGSLSSVGHFTNIGGDSTTRPTYISSLSCLRFDGANDYLTLSGTQTYTAQTTFVVTQARNFVTASRIFNQAASGFGSSATYSQFIQSGNTGIVASWTESLTTARSQVSHRGLSAFDTFTSWHSGGGLINFRNGESGTPYIHNLGSFVVLRHRLGASISAAGTADTGFYTGDISEVIVYSRALTNAEREDVEYYLSRKWSVLNSIPRQVYALKSGNWSDSTLWSVSADPSPWNFPLSADNVYTNTFTVTANTSTRVDTIRNSPLAYINFTDVNLTPNVLAGGSIVLSNGVSLSARLGNRVGSLMGPALVTTAPQATASLVNPFFNDQVGSRTFDPVLSCLPGTTTTITFSPSCSYVFTNIGQNVAVNQGTLIVNGSINLIGGNANAALIVSTSTNGVVTINGNITSSAGAAVIQGGNGSGFSGIVNINGDITASSGSTCINSNTGTLNIVGTLRGGTSSPLTTTGFGQTNTTNVTGDCYDYCIGPNANASINARVIGNLYGFNGTVIQGVFSSGYTQNVYVSGSKIIGGGILVGGTSGANNFVRVIGADIISTNTFNAINQSTGTQGVWLTGCNIINAPNGRQAIYAPNIRMFPGTSPTYTRHAVNGYDSFVDYWTSDATFSYPSSSNVAQNVLYSNNTLSGSMIVPPVSSVFLGVPVQLSKGTLVPMTPSSFWNTSINSLSASDSIGLRLKNITTTEALSSIVKSLVYQ